MPGRSRAYALRTGDRCGQRRPKSILLPQYQPRSPAEGLNNRLRRLGGKAAGARIHDVGGRRRKPGKVRQPPFHATPWLAPEEVGAVALASHQRYLHSIDILE